MSDYAYQSPSGNDITISEAVVTRHFVPREATRFLVTKEVEFDAGHRVPDHASKCRNPHGHRYRVVAGVAGGLQESGSSRSMVLDFADIKAALNEHVHDKYDHGFIVYRHDDVMADFVYSCYQNDWKVVIVDWPPTAEEMARAIYKDLEEPIKAAGGQLGFIRVYETPTSMAHYPW